MTLPPAQPLLFDPKHPAMRRLRPMGCVWFPGTGPGGATCGGCVFSYYRDTARSWGAGKVYCRVTEGKKSRRNRPFSPKTKACKHYEGKTTT